MKVLELFSGIGGMHMALKESGVPDAVVQTAIDINPTANTIYRHNFPNTTQLNRNIDGLTATFLNQFDTILMSPPCQPFTRNGLQKDVDDNRTSAFKHILNLIKSLSDNNIENILIENVVGFENSLMREELISTLDIAGYYYREFELTPCQFGVPNSRMRYYCVARKHGPIIDFVVTNSNCWNISRIIDNNNIDSYCLLSDKILEKYHKVLDICNVNSRASCCFTRAYTRYIEGTGSVYTDKTEDCVQKAYDLSVIPDAVNIEPIRSLNLRFFTPLEVSRLMSFPDYFQFPEGITDRQKYRVLGNSVNVTVVAELIKLFLVK